MSRISKSLVIAVRPAMVMAVSVFAAISAAELIRSFFQGVHGVNWNDVSIFSGIAGGATFVWIFVSAYLNLRQISLLDALSGGASASQSKREAYLGAFLAMEYYLLIWNRSFVVFATDKALRGWKFVGAVTAGNTRFFQPYAEMISEPGFEPSLKELDRLVRPNDCFKIMRDEIASAVYDSRPKWGMGGIPHSGKILLELTSGGKRELILLGRVDGAAVRGMILGCGAVNIRM